MSRICEVEMDDMFVRWMTLPCMVEWHDYQRAAVEKAFDVGVLVQLVDKRSRVPIFIFGSNVFRVAKVIDLESLVLKPVFLLEGSDD